MLFLYSHNEKTATFEHESAIDCKHVEFENGANEMLFYPVPFGHFSFFQRF